EITRQTRIVTANDKDSAAVGRYLAGVLRPSTGFPLPVGRDDKEPRGDHGDIALLIGASQQVGKAGYELTVTKHGVTLRANTSDGLFAGVQTLRQLLPAT